MTENLIAHLADVIRRYNTGPYGSGGKRTIGTLILQRGERRIPLDPKRIPEEWPEGSTVPEEVADILLSIQFDQKKAVASVFDAAEEVSRCLGLNLSWDEDFKLGAFLISCLIKAEYYSLYNLYWTGSRIEYGLSARKKEVLEYPVGDWYTNFSNPFPEWTGPIDDAGRWLVKPSTPQQKKTFWKPEEKYFRGSNKSIAGMVVDVATILGMNPRWIKAVHKLESNAYRINQDLLKVVNAIAEDENTAPPKTNPVLDAEKKELDREFRRKRKGWAIVDGKKLFEWTDFVDKRYEVKLPKKQSKVVETRSLQHLSELKAAQETAKRKKKKQDQERKDKKLKPHPKSSAKRTITAEQEKVLNEFWRRWYQNKTARDVLATKHSDFHRTLTHCNEYLQDNEFYHRVFLDYRGRMYLSRSVVNYQGGDLQRALIDFAEGKKVRNTDMNHLFTRLGDLFGIKGDRQQKEIGGRQHEKKFLKWGKNPVKTYDQWKVHGDKWQLIRACMELYALHKNPNHKSTLICEIDQTTSILQHIALIERDPILAEQANLTDTYNDIYSKIADGVKELDGLSVGDKRKVVKTALLAWGYGGNAWTACQDYHKEDLPFLANMKAGDRLRLAITVVKAIEKALPAAKQYRDDWKGPIDKRWEKIAKGNVIFPTSSRFEVHCVKQQVNKKRQEIWQKEKSEEADRNDKVRLTAYRPNNRRDNKKLSKAMAPNLVHSVDASVIHAVLEGMGDDVSAVTVHDAVGTHLRDVDIVRDVFRVSFYQAYKYENHPLQLLKDDPHDGPRDQETMHTMGEILDKVFRSKHMI